MCFESARSAGPRHPGLFAFSLRAQPVQGDPKKALIESFYIIGNDSWKHEVTGEHIG
jgi:hypothetical protein